MPEGNTTATPLTEVVAARLRQTAFGGRDDLESGRMRSLYVEAFGGQGHALDDFQLSDSLTATLNSDNSWSIMDWDAVRPMPAEERARLPSRERLEQTLERIRMAAKKNNIQWLGTARGMDHNGSIDAGMRMLPGDNEKVVMAAREYTKRKMPA